MQGDTVEWFSANFPGALREEVVDGVHFVRDGHQWSVHWAAFRRYRRTLAKRFDVVVDEVNTIPFFTPMWAEVPSVMFIHQLAREVWWYESRFPISLIGYLAERHYLRPYRKTPVITVSQSTQADLRQLGFRGRITVIPEGLEPLSDLRVARSTTPRFLFVGRLAPSKRVDQTIRAFAIFYDSQHTGSLSIIGDGSQRYVHRLQELAQKLGVVDRVHFLGRVSKLVKHREMASAHALLLASVREGWGLVVIEANAFGTPAIAYDSPGLRDSIRHLETGLLVQPAPEALAEAMIRVWHESDLYERLSANSIAWSQSFSFERTAGAVREALVFEVDDQHVVEAT